MGTMEKNSATAMIGKTVTLVLDEQTKITGKLVGMELANSNIRSTVLGLKKDGDYIFHIKPSGQQEWMQVNSGSLLDIEV